MHDPLTRREYQRASLDVDALDRDPIAQFRAWLDEAASEGVAEPTAMTLATADAEGRPSARTVLLKGLDDRGFAFYTNLASRKARDLTANPRAALVFRWEPLERQVVVTGAVKQVSAEEADAYFATRPRDSQLAAWASPQSQPITERGELEERFVELQEAYDGREIPRPPGWGGFRLTPAEIEFWQGRPARLHDRIRYRRGAGGPGDGAWDRERLAP